MLVLDAELCHILPCRLLEGWHVGGYGAAMGEWDVLRNEQRMQYFAVQLLEARLVVP